VEKMSIVDAILERPRLYSLWQKRFATQKIEPVERDHDLTQIRRVLDIGCGPGTNRQLLSHSHYIGLDINPRYVKDARTRFGGEYVVADVGNLPLKRNATFDFILVNSLLHHLPDALVHSLLGQLEGLLSIDGTVHILDLVLPQERSVARLLARWDRGDYARPAAEWQHLFGQHFLPLRFLSYDLRAIGIPLWHMVYFKGAIR
jgi:SAM-dependent methyltransferase